MCRVQECTTYYSLEIFLYIAFVYVCVGFLTRK